LQGRTKRILEKADGRVRCREPFELKKPPPGSASTYPAFEAVVVNGMTEIIQHRRMEPVFYITDDAAVWERYRAIGCD
jgi:hypothetical protein